MSKEKVNSYGGLSFIGTVLSDLWDKAVNPPKFFPIEDNLIEEILQEVEKSYLEDVKQLDIKNLEDEKELEIFHSLDAEDIVLFNKNSSKIDELRRLVTEEVYHYLGFLSEELVGYEDTVIFNDAISYEMSRVLGLSRDHMSVQKLTDQLVQWIIQSKQFTTGWGEISYLPDENKVRLKSFDEDGPVELKIALKGQVVGR